MRLPNGFGNVSKLPGNRRRPYRARITTGWELKEGKRKQKFRTIGYFKTKEEGIIALANLRQFSSPCEIPAATITFRQVYEEWSKEHYPKTSYINRQGYQIAYGVCGDLYEMDFKKIKRIHLQTVIDTCGKNYPSLKKIKILFSQIYKYAIQNDICDKNYSEYVDIAQYREKNPNTCKRLPFTEDELSFLWKVKDNNIYYSTILMLIYTGCRVSELLNLQKSEINLEAQYFFVSKSKTQAGIRYVPIANKVLPFFQYWYTHSTGKYLLETPNGYSFSYRNYYESYWKPLLETLKMKHKPHDTRHTCVTLLTIAKIDDKIIKKIVGHRGQTITETIYTHFEIKELLDAINKI